jgi:hypothetical protein
MSDDRMGGIALIAGAVGSLVVMALHPTGRDLLTAGGGFERVAIQTAGVHALAIASMPVSFLGALALSRRLAAPDRLGVMAIVCYGFALAAGMAAAAASGFVGPDLARQIVAEDPAAADAWRIAFHYNGGLNQAFASILVVASSAAIVLWSAAILKGRTLARGVGLYGLVLGPVVVLALLSGYLILGVHGFGLVVLGQTIWFVAVGVQLARWRAAGPEPG